MKQNKKIILMGCVGVGFATALSNEINKSKLQVIFDDIKEDFEKITQEDIFGHDKRYNKILSSVEPTSKFIGKPRNNFKKR